MKYFRLTSLFVNLKNIHSHVIIIIIYLFICLVNGIELKNQKERVNQDFKEKKNFFKINLIKNKKIGKKTSKFFINFYLKLIEYN